MKIFFFSAFLPALFGIKAMALAPIPVPPPPAPSLFCHSIGVADAGFNLRVAPNRRSALLGQISFSGPQPIAQLRCQRLYQTPGHPERNVNYLLCEGYSPQFRNLAVRLYHHGMGLPDSASVRSVSFVRGRRMERQLRFGNLTCPSLVH